MHEDDGINYEQDVDPRELLGGFVRMLEKLRAVEQRHDDAARRAAISHVLIGVAHEVERALASILADLYGASELLERGNDDERPWVEESLRTARASITQARAMLGDALVLSSEQRPVRDLVALDGIVARAALIARHAIHQRACLVIQIGDVGLVEACAAELVQAIVALLSNAVQSFTTADPQRNRILLTARNYGRRLVIEVTDNGRGIPASLRERLFEPYFTTRNDGSIGLGLAIASTIVTAHHGTLTLRASEIGIGSTFRISLPAPDLFADTQLGTPPPTAPPTTGGAQDNS